MTDTPDSNTPNSENTDFFADLFVDEREDEKYIPDENDEKYQFDQENEDNAVENWAGTLTAEDDDDAASQLFEKFVEEDSSPTEATNSQEPTEVTQKPQSYETQESDIKNLSSFADEFMADITGDSAEPEHIPGSDDDYREKYVEGNYFDERYPYDAKIPDWNPDEHPGEEPPHELRGFGTKSEEYGVRKPAWGYLPNDQGKTLYGVVIMPREDIPDEERKLLRPRFENNADGVDYRDPQYKDWSVDDRPPRDCDKFSEVSQMPHKVLEVSEGELGEVVLEGTEYGEHIGTHDNRMEQRQKRHERGILMQENMARRGWARPGGKAVYNYEKEGEGDWDGKIAKDERKPGKTQGGKFTDLEILEDATPEDVDRVYKTKEFYTRSKGRMLIQKSRREHPVRFYRVSEDGVPDSLRKLIDENSLQSIKSKLSPEDWAREVIARRELRWSKLMNEWSLASTEKNMSIISAAETMAAPIDTKRMNLDNLAKRLDAKFEKMSGRMNEEKRRAALRLAVPHEETAEEIIAKLALPANSVFETQQEAEARMRKSLAKIRTRKGFGKLTKRMQFRDMLWLEFMCMFKYASENQIADLSGISRVSAMRRLLELSAMQLITAIPLVGGIQVWVPTALGASIAGYPDISRVTNPNHISFQLFSHQKIVTHVASNLISGGLNVLQLDPWPALNRKDYRGKWVAGEYVVSELQILQAAHSAANRWAAAWYNDAKNMCAEDKKLITPGYSPEQRRGKEYTWALYPPSYLINYHFPDLVLRRPRNEDLTPESIAIEVELSKKPSRSILTTLRSYMDDDWVYKKVVWVVRSRAVARQLEIAAKQIGLWQEGRMDIVPILTKDGFLKAGEKIWTL